MHRFGKRGIELHNIDEQLGLLYGDEETKETPLHHVCNLADPFDYSTHENQLILAKQLIERGANVNAVSIPKNETPLHYACYSFNVTNLDFVELLLEVGADPNARDYLGWTPLMSTTEPAPGVAKFLLNWRTNQSYVILEAYYIEEDEDIQIQSDSRKKRSPEG
jgi:hypothetical protein